VLNSLELNTVLVTYGNVDTYPALIWQYMNNYRQDVLILCIDWLGNETYRSKVASALGLNANDLNSTNAEAIVKKVTQSSLRPVYLSLTLPPAVLKSFKSNLFCVGLAMKYSNTEIANLPTLQSNWETRMNKNTLGQNDPINRNYILPLILLSNYYQDLGNEQAKAQIDTLLNALATNFGLQKTIDKHTD
jgi:hypothetical protein